MKFVELKQNLKKQIDNVYLIYGEDRYLQDKSIEMIKKICIDNYIEMNQSIFTDENINIQQMLEQAQTLPFMSNFRLIIMRDCFNKLTDSEKKQIKDYIKSPVKTTIFIMCVNEKNEFLKSLHSSVNEVDCSFMDAKTLGMLVPIMLKEYGKQITTNALNKLLEYCSYDLGRIENEIKKLSIISSSDVITPDEVEINVAKTIDYEVYILANAICEKDTEYAIRLYEHILAKKGSTQYILSTLATFMRRYFYLHATKSDKQLCLNTFKITDYIMQVNISKSNNLKKGALMNCLNKILETDYEIKAGKQTENNAMYNLILYLTTKL